MLLLWIVPLEAEDFEAFNSNQTFLPGLEYGTVCLTVLILMDEVIEAPEQFQVFVGSTDAAVLIRRSFVNVTIGDTNAGK